MAKEPPRSPQRKHDPLARLEHDRDARVASADQDGSAYLVPLFCL